MESGWDHLPVIWYKAKDKTSTSPVIVWNTVCNSPADWGTFHKFHLDKAEEPKGGQIHNR